MTSSKAKSVEASLKVKVIVAVWPAMRVSCALLVTVRVGNTVSTVSDKLLLTLALPAASLNLSFDTLIVAGVLLLASGVKVAVYSVLETAAKLDNAPPSTTTSS